MLSSGYSTVPSVFPPPSSSSSTVQLYSTSSKGAFRSKVTPWIIFTALVVLCVAIAVGVLIWQCILPIGWSHCKSSSSSNNNGGDMPEVTVYRITSGLAQGAAPYTDTQGNKWYSDTSYLSSQTTSVVNAGGQQITGTNDPFLFSNTRFGPGGGLTLTLPNLNPSYTYNVTLFASAYSGISYSETVSINNQIWLSNFDVSSSNTNTYQAVIRISPFAMPVLSTSGVLTLSFTSTTRQSYYSSILVMRSDEPDPW